MPRLVPDDELVTANAVNGQVSNVSRLAGSALGGILAAAGGIVAAAYRRRMRPAACSATARSPSAW